MTAIAPAKACESPAISHPLEIIPIFRRWRRGLLRDILYTLVWDTLIAVVLTGFGVLFDSRTPIVQMLWVTFVFAQCVGVVIHVLFMIGDRIVPGMHQKSLPVRFVYYSAVPIIGVFAGYPIG